MSRSTAEWRGKTEDTPAPPRVRVRVFDAHSGHCHRCHRKIRAGERWTLEHVKALINGGENRENNLDVTCDWCLLAKNAEDVAEKSITARHRKKHLGITRPKHKWPKRGMNQPRVDRTKHLEDL